MVCTWAISFGLVATASGIASSGTIVVSSGTIGSYRLVKTAIKNIKWCKFISTHTVYEVITRQINECTICSFVHNFVRIC